MSRRQSIKEQGFAVEAGGRAAGALAGSISQARALCSEDWFVEKLAYCRSQGRPIWDGSTELPIRRAGTPEAAEIQIAPSTELARKEYEGYVFVFFVPVDADLH
jgi:hypothetical protein